VDITPSVHLSNGHPGDESLEVTSPTHPRVADALSTLIRDVLWGENATMEDTPSASATIDVPRKAGTEEGWENSDCLPDEIYYSDISAPASETHPDAVADQAAADTVTADDQQAHQTVQEEKEKDKEKPLSEQLEELKQNYAILQHMCRNLKDELRVLLDHHRDERMLRYDAESRYEISEFSKDLLDAQVECYKRALGIATVNYAAMVRRFHSISGRLNSLAVIERVEEVISNAEREGY
jgi:hypothetical protein